MAFGFKKKPTFAHSIYRNGHIYTGDPNYPWASAVACEGGKILAVGEYDAMDAIIGEDTVTYDLEGKYMFPGFISIHSKPVMDIFEDMYLYLDPELDLETTLEEIREYAEDNEDLSVIFAYGYRENLFDGDDSEKAMALLDEIDMNRPILILGESGVHLWYNSTARRIIMETVDEDGVEFLHFSYIMSMFLPFDFDQVAKATREEMEDLSDKGYTSVYAFGAPEYFDSLFMDNAIEFFSEDYVRQRVYGSLYVTRPLNPATLSLKMDTARTTCLEMGDMLSYNHVHIVLGREDSEVDFSQNALDTILLAMADKGYNIHIEALNHEGLVKAYTSFDAVRNKGYKKNMLVIYSNDSLTPLEKGEIANFETIMQTWAEGDEYGDDFGDVFTQSDSALEALEALTIKAAEILGISESYGSIEKGKVADFTIFNDNPLDLGLDQFSYMHAENTIIAGEVAYDAEEAAKDEMYNMLLTQQL